MRSSLHMVSSSAATTQGERASKHSVLAIPFIHSGGSRHLGKQRKLSCWGRTY